MTNKEAVLEVLSRISTLSAPAIAERSFYLLGHKMTAAQVNGAIRPLMKEGKVGASNYGLGHNVYFLIREDN